MSNVTVEDVRISLNEISEEELKNSVIQQKIDDATYIMDNRGVTGYPRIKFIRAYAALKSFIVSNTYSRTNFGSVSVQREWKAILNALEEDLEEAVTEAGLHYLIVEDTAMFDDRPSDDTEDDDELVSLDI